HHHVGRVDLVGGEEALRANAERRRHAGAVLLDQRGLVVRSLPAVEALIDAAGHAAVAGEEGVANARERGERRGLESGAHDSNPGSSPSRGCAMAMTLNISPMPVRPGAVKRASAASIASACAAVAPALSLPARSTMPRRRRNSP